MKVTRIIKTTEYINLDITGITLLSVEEYRQFDVYIPPINAFWWLRSPGYYSHEYTVVIEDNGYMNTFGNIVAEDFIAVRPTLILNLESSNLQIKDEFEFGGYTWTVLSDEYAICNGFIAKHCFREDWRVEDANDYEKSDVKKYIEDWLNVTMENQREAADWE